MSQLRKGREGRCTFPCIEQQQRMGGLPRVIGEGDQVVSECGVGRIGCLVRE